jgi:DNA replication protein DnaC
MGHYNQSNVIGTLFDGRSLSQWDAIFPDSVMTVAAVDRLVYHALIVDIQGESYRKHTAEARSKETLAEPKAPSTAKRS